MQMVMFIKDSGKTIKPMGKEFIYIKMELLILVNGLKIYNMVMESKNGSINRHIKGILIFKSKEL
jgi:hypothetical protein